MGKNIWNIFRYLLLAILIISSINALYLHELKLMFDGIILILFWISMILKDKSSDKNKVASIVYYSTAVIIAASIILEVFFGLNI